MLPEFYGKFDGELIRTFKKMLFSLLKSPDDASGNEAVAVLREQREQLKNRHAAERGRGVAALDHEVKPELAV